MKPGFVPIGASGGETADRWFGPLAANDGSGAPNPAGLDEQLLHRDLEIEVCSTPFFKGPSDTEDGETGDRYGAES